MEVLASGGVAAGTGAARGQVRAERARQRMATWDLGFERRPEASIATRS